MRQTPESAALTRRIIELRKQGLTFAQIGARVNLSKASVRERWYGAQKSKRRRVARAHDSVAVLQAEIERLKGLIP
jgi:orotate phosphoribosyltransferase-like protein